MLNFLTSAISFPGLGIEINPSDGFSIGNFTIKWYGVIIALGVLLATIYLLRRVKQFGLTEDDILNMLLIGLPSAIVCARLYYVIFEWDQFFGPGIPWYRFLDIRSGGLAIYGGVIGGALAVFIYTRVKKQPVLPYLDIMGLGLLIGQTVGRWGNFFNREAHGSVTDCFLRMGLYENGRLQYFHPTFLYESVWNLVGFVILHFASKKRKYDGEIFLGYIAWYGLGRAIIEGLRTDSLYIGPLRVSQWLAGISCAAAVAILIYERFFVKHGPESLLVNRVAQQQETPDETERSEQE